MADEVVIRCRPDGPLVVKGPFKLVDPAGNEIPLPGGKDNVALCRCGHSRHKPFCDGSHKVAGFKSGEDAPPAT